MKKIMNDIYRFKDQWKSTKTVTPLVPDEIAEMIRMYTAIGPGQDSLKYVFSKRWDRLSEQKKIELVDRLLKNDLLPPQVEEVLRLFNGKIVGLF